MLPVPHVLLGMLVLGYVLFVGELSIRRHEGFGSRAYDLGIYDQALWLISQGHRPFVTVRELHILGDHFTPILYPLALLYRFGRGVEHLLWFQTVALALGSVPLYRMGLRMATSPGIGLLAGGLYLLYPPLRAVNLCDFHPVALTIPGVLFALDFAAERRPGAFIAACLWTALCKQEAALVVGCLGVWYAVRWREPRALLVCLGGALWFLAAVRLQAYFAGAHESAYVELYSQFGTSTGQILRTLLLTPWIPLRSIATTTTGTYLLLLLTPLALLPLRAPGILWLLLVPLMLNLLSKRAAMRDVDLHSTALLIPVLFAAGTAALATVSRASSRRAAAGAWALCAGIAALTHVPVPQSAASDPPLSPSQAAAVTRVLASIPRAASVSATQSLIPHLAHRRCVHLFPNPFWALATGPSRRAIRQELGGDHPHWDPTKFQQALTASDVEYLVLGYRLSLRVGSFPSLLREELPLLAETLRNPAYGVVADEAGLWVLRRGADHREGLRHLGLALSKSAPESRWRQEVWRRINQEVIQ